MHCLSYSTSSPSEISIAYSQLQSIDEIKISSPHKVSKLSIVHCKLDSLRGIEKFTGLTHLNLKFNNLDNAEEIMRISNKQILKQLCLQGNSIQYYSLCTFFSLRTNGFENLMILNNKDYSKWGKNRKKGPSMKKINSKLEQMQRSMAKTLKRTIRNNVIEKYKLCHEIEQEDDETSRQSSKQRTVSSHERTPFRQISLSNVNMIKSVKREASSPDKSKMPQLVIEPIQFCNEDQIAHMPLTQPTATFASQKQRQCLPFKRNNYAAEINAVTEMEENFKSEDDELYEISYHTNNASFLRVRPSIGIQNKSALDDFYDDVNEQVLCLVEGFYLQNLLKRGLKGLRSSKSRNMPRKVPYV